MRFTPQVIQQLHSLLFAYHPAQGGRWKATDNEIVERDADGAVTRVRFKAVPAVLTADALRQLASLHADASGAAGHDPLTLLPLTILDFLCIHPFQDGNGRVGRLLTLMLLYQAEYEAGQYISLERLVEESRDSCYEALEESSSVWHEGRHDPLPWARYLWGVLLRAHHEFEDRIRHVSEGRGSKTEQVRSAVLSMSKPFSASELERACPGVGRDPLRKVLRAMRDEGLVRPRGTGGERAGACWRREVRGRGAVDVVACCGVWVRGAFPWDARSGREA